jgi:hypothetical protein
MLGFHSQVAMRRHGALGNKKPCCEDCKKTGGRCADKKLGLGDAAAMAAYNSNARFAKFLADVGAAGILLDVNPPGSSAFATQTAAGLTASLTITYMDPLTPAQAGDAVSAAAKNNGLVFVYTSGENFTVTDPNAKGKAAQAATTSSNTGLWLLAGATAIGVGVLAARAGKRKKR